MHAHTDVGTYVQIAHTCFARKFLDGYFWATLYVHKVTYYWFDWAWCRQSNIWGLNSVELIQLTSLKKLILYETDYWTRLDQTT